MIIASDDKLSFQITPYVFGELEDYFSVDVSGGTWYIGEDAYVATNVSGIGDQGNPYIILTRGAEGSGVATISASPTAPYLTDINTIRLIGTLVYNTLSADPDEELANPSMEGSNVLERIEQYIIGDIYNNGEDTRNISFKMSVLTDTQLRVAAGFVNRNGPQISVPQTDLSMFSPSTHYYIYLELQSPTEDPAISTYSAEIKSTTDEAIFNEFYNRGVVIMLGEIDTDEDSKITIDKIHHEGDVDDFWVVPDGSSIATTYPKIKSLSFNTAIGDHHYELQDYRAHESIIDATTFLNGDAILPFFVKDAGDIPKQYCYVDSHGREAGRSSDWKSLEIYALGRLQLYQFSESNGLIENDSRQVDSWDEDGPHYWEFLIRDTYVNNRQLRYAKITFISHDSLGDVTSDLTSATSSTLGTSKRAARVDHTHTISQDVIDEIIGGVVSYIESGYILHHDKLIFESDDHVTEGVDRYIINDGNAARNNMSGVIGDSYGLSSIEPNSRYLIDTSETVSISWVERTLCNLDGRSSVRWDRWELYDSSFSPVCSANWNTRILYGIDGDDVSINWASRKLFKSDGSTTAESLDWENQILKGTEWQVDGDLEPVVDNNSKLGVLNRWYEASIRQIYVDQLSPDGTVYSGNINCNGNLVSVGSAYGLGNLGCEWSSLYLGSAGVIYINGITVVSQQQPAVADASGGSTVDTEARTAINDLLARLRTHGLIAT